MTLRETISQAIDEQLAKQAGGLSGYSVGPDVFDSDRMADAVVTEVKRYLVGDRPEDRLRELDWQMIEVRTSAAGHDGDPLLFLVMPPQPQGVPCALCGKTYAEFPNPMIPYDEPGVGQRLYAHAGCAADEQWSRDRGAVEGFAP